MSFLQRENDFDDYRKLNFILNIYREVMSFKLAVIFHDH
jgi:hypothetical protein